MVDPKDPRSRTCVVDDEFIQAFLVDYFVTTAAIASLGVLLGALMRRKAYFQLATLGARAARAYGGIMLGVCAVAGATPVFLL